MDAAKGTQAACNEATGCCRMEGESLSLRKAELNKEISTNEKNYS